ncbi:PIN domain-containing protein [Microbispora bryophytorum]|uniref:PIN domain-containing protein n=1 Tax=Microbispora bryophytorum TaxID=1460882 RepID=UPI0034087EF7
MGSHGFRRTRRHLRADQAGVPQSSRRAAFYEADSLLRETFPYYFIPESAWDETSRLQRELADRGWHQCASPVDLLVAVTAQHHKLTVLHADADFDAIARLTGQPVRWIS